MSTSRKQCGRQRERGGRPRERGTALVIVLAVVFGVGLLALSMHFSATAEMASAANYRDAISALFIADAGIEHAIAELGADSNWRGTMSTLGYALDRDLHNGHYRTWVWSASDDPEWDLSRRPGGTVHVRSLGTGLLGGERTVDTLITPPAVRGILGFAAFACNDLYLEGGADVVTGGHAYSGHNYSQKGGSYAGGNISAINDAKLDSDAYLTGNMLANHKADPHSDLSTVVYGNVDADTVDHPERVSGTVTTGVTPVPTYCDNPSAGYTTFFNTLQPLTRLDVATFVALPGTTTHAGDWVISSNTLLVGSHHVTDGKWTVGEISLTYSGHVVVVVEGDTVTFDKTTIRLAAGGDDSQSSLTVISRQKTIEFKSGTDADFRGVIYLGLIDTATNPHTMPANADIKIAGTLKLRGSIIGVANHVKVSPGNLLQLDPSTVSSPIFRTVTTLTVGSWGSSP